MDATQQINAFNEFLESHYYAQLLENVRLGNNFLSLDFELLSQFSPELANILLESPEDTIKAAELSVEQFDLPKQVKNFKIRFGNLPESQKMMIRNIRSKHLGNLYSFDGVVRQKSDVRPQVTSARFECPSCGNIISVLQLEKKFKEPTNCGCGRKGKFRMLSKELIDAQGLVLEEAPEDLDGGEQPKRVNVFLKDDLVSPLTDKKTNPGSKVTVVGLIKEVPVTGRDGGKLTRFDLLIEGNNIEAVQEDYYEVEISKEDEEEIKKISKDPHLFKKITNSVAPTIYGYEKIKFSIALQLAGGVRKVRKDGTVTRGDMHVLLIGDPGGGKSQILKRVSKIAPKARYVSGKGVSGAGLSAAVVKDEFLQGWSLEAGALPLSNKGVCCIDEMDKMDEGDTSAMHEALENQTITISKANIQATLRAETTVLAAANPKFGRFDPYDIIAKQINLPPALINRFDLIFAIKDMPDEERDRRLAGHILKLHQDPDMDEPTIDTDMLKKYISFIRQRCKPVLTDEALETIQKYYVEIRNKGSQEEAGVKSVPISARQLEALVRMSEGTAKLRMSTRVEKSDAENAIELLHFCLTQIGVDPETGKIDIDRIVTGISASQRSKISNIKEIINEIENQVGKTIPLDDVVKLAQERGIDETDVDEGIEKLKRSGDIFEPKPGFISKI